MRYGKAWIILSSCKYDEDYFINGVQTGKSLYSQYRWVPELSIPFAHALVQRLRIERGQRVLDFGCACGYLVKALRLLGINAYGLDTSMWAIDQSPKDVEEYIEADLERFDERFDVCIAKDVLEHLPYEDLPTQLKRLRQRCMRMFVIVPLAKDGKYIAEAHELDKTHVIRRDMDWWRRRFFEAGYTRVDSHYECPGAKEAWTRKYPNGIGFLEAQ